MGNPQGGPMKLLNRTLLLALLLTLPLSAADPLYGVWKMRPSGKPRDKSNQTMTIEPVADGIKFTTDIDFGSGAGMSTTYVTKLDGAEVPVYSADKIVMKVRGKRTGSNTYEGSATGPGGTITSKTTISADGKTMTIDGMTGSIASHAVFDRVK
jgi:hypothetical protein